MNRIKTYDATGIAPNGKLYAGDLNLLQDTVAALSDFAQTFDSSTLRIGDTSLSISKFGAGELAISSALRVAGYLRANGGLVEANLTTTQRNALVSPPTGTVIYNTTTVRPEINIGTPAAPNWSAFGFIPANGVSITDADVAAAAALSISKFSGYPTDATKALWGDGTWRAPLTAPTVSGGNYTLLLTDINKVVEMNVAGANTLTVPPNSSVAFAIGATITVAQYGAGQTTIAPGAGVTLRSYNANLKIAGQYGVAGLIKRGTDEWYVAGNLVP